MRKIIWLLVPVLVIAFCGCSGDNGDAIDFLPFGGCVGKVKTVKSRINMTEWQLGKLKSTNDSDCYWVDEYDRKGNRTCRRRVNDDGSIEYEYSYKWDRNHYLVSCSSVRYGSPNNVIYEKDDEGFWKGYDYFEVEGFKEENGTVFKYCGDTVISYHDGKVSYKQIYQGGRLVREINCFEGKDDVQIIREYDDKGNLEWEKISGSVTNYEYTKFDEKGNWIERYIIDEDSNHYLKYRIESREIVYYKI